MPAKDLVSKCSVGDLVAGHADATELVVQEASKQMTTVSSQAEEETAKLRASYKQQIAALEAQVADLQHAAPARHSARSQTRSASSTDANCMPGAALHQRVQQLEAANAALEQALVDAHDRQPRNASAERHSAESDALLHHARATDAQCEQQVSQLQAQLHALQVWLSLATRACV